jgi:AcrR family transcriptional regulator
MEDSKPVEKTRGKIRRERENENHRNEIIQAAEKIFRSHGFTKATMKHIADEAGFAKGTVYNYFENKEELYLAIGSRSVQKLNEFYRDAISDSKSKSKLEQLRSLGFAYYGFVRKFPGYADILHNTETKESNISYFSILERKESNINLNRSERDYLIQVKEMREILMRTVEEAIENNEIRSDISSSVIRMVLSNLTSSLVFDLMRREKLWKKSGLSGNQLLSIVFDLITDGLKPKTTD